LLEKRSTKTCVPYRGARVWAKRVCTGVWPSCQRGQDIPDTSYRCLFVQEENCRDLNLTLRIPEACGKPPRSKKGKRICRVVVLAPLVQQDRFACLLKPKVRSLGFGSSYQSTSCLLFGRIKVQTSTRAPRSLCEEEIEYHG
jgi:hypothetical protein